MRQVFVFLLQSLVFNHKFFLLLCDGRNISVLDRVLHLFEPDLHLLLPVYLYFCFNLLLACAQAGI